MVRTRRFHRPGCGFNPRSGNEDPASHTVQSKNKVGDLKNKNKSELL